jgi:protein phosphatase
MVGIEKNTLEQPKIPSIQSAQCCHLGAVRTRNEDSLLIIDTITGGQIPLNNFGLYIVADGMGGHHAGHEASRRTSRILGHRILREIYIPLLADNPPINVPIQELMSKAIQEANETLYNPEPDKDMGTTITAALIFGERLYLAHVGDSRAYLLHDGKLELMTTDHSYVQRLQDAGQLTPEEAAVHPQRNVLYRAVGQGGQLEVEVFTRSLPPQGKLLLCSDGLWGLVPNEVLQEILKQPISLQEQTNHLVEYALEAGGYDNITVIIVDFTF